MSTFSQTVDEFLVEMVRPDLLVFMCDALNQVIREQHIHPDSGMPIFYMDNRVEVEWTVPDPLPAVWSIPSVPRFQFFESAYYPSQGRYAKPGVDLKRVFENGVDAYAPYWYRSGPAIVFNGLAVAEVAQFSYFEYPRRLLYYATATPQLRPAIYNIETGAYTYATSYDVNATTRENARNLVTNWLLLRWPELLKQGMRAKYFARIGEDGRSKIAYSTYQAMRMGLVTSESFALHNNP